MNQVKQNQQDAKNWTLCRSIQCWVRPASSRLNSNDHYTAFEYSANCVDDTRDSVVYNIRKGEKGFTKCERAYEEALKPEKVKSSFPDAHYSTRVPEYLLSPEIGMLKVGVTLVNLDTNQKVEIIKLRMYCGGCAATLKPSGLRAYKVQFAGDTTVPGYEIPGYVVETAVRA